MRWGRKQLREEKKKPFSLTHLLPFSWVCKLIPDKPSPESAKPKGTTQVTPIPDPKTVPISTSDDLDRFVARFPHPVAASGAGYVPRRLSLGDDDGLRPRSRRVRHYSVGDDRDLAGSQTLGHLIPFSRSSHPPPPPSSESDPSEIDPSADRRREQRRRRRRRRMRRALREGRKSFSGKIRTRSSRVRIRSPRIPRAEEETDLEKFAVVKKSSDPQKDFRESMVEMIAEKGIGRPEELESLLACYLTLNSDEHHDVIVQVFRQVWFEISPERFGSHRRSNSTPV
ncbi:uncharacterized protein [Typha latifolia]|uniref:uncharacterized protein n=1 Tax=Typha latifolia TaxID=4733 RepID=UPI003C300E88